MSEVLFIVKRGQISGGYCSAPMWSSGLKNSALFVVEMLNANRVPSVLEEAIDANCIDRLVHNHKPRVVILEAIWCPPSKLDELVGLYPKIQWIVRLHSEVTFLALEGCAIEWINDYKRIKNVHIAANSDRTVEDLQHAVVSNLLFLPNYYTPEESRTDRCLKEDAVHIGCFGAIRPMKNHLAQAIAAIRFAGHGKTLYFHVNAGRVEQGGQQVLKNLRALFRGHHNRFLVEHDWMTHEAFLRVLSCMDISTAVSLTESFNVVTADAVTCGVPVVVSKEIRWVAPGLQADATSIENIVNTMHRATGFARHYYLWDNKKRLRSFNEASRKIWLSTLWQWL